MSLAAYREARSERKRRAIIDAATRLFAEHGLTAVSMAALAGEAGVSTATLYRHFTAKEDVFAAVIDELVSRFNDQTQRDDPDCRRALAHLSRRYAQLLTDPTVVGLLRAVAADHDRSGGFRDRLARHGSAIFETDFDRLIASCFQAAGVVVDVKRLRHAGIALGGALEHVTLVPALLFHEFPDPAGLEEQVQTIVANWLKRWPDAPQYLMVPDRP
ncbi:MAG: helix-turn-helix domain-containing protein [Pseudomonadales bacterium]